MKKRVLVLMALGITVVATYFVTAASATTVVYLSPHHMIWTGGSSERSGFTGVGWDDNFMLWQDPNGGTPSGCTSYVNTSEVLYKPLACSNTQIELDGRTETNYAAAYCTAASSNGKVILMETSNSDGCTADDG